MLGKPPLACPIAGVVVLSAVFGQQYSAKIKQTAKRQLKRLVS
jgi:hypothetical protein